MTALPLGIAALVFGAALPWIARDRVLAARRAWLGAPTSAPVAHLVDVGPRVPVPVALELVGAAMRSGSGVPRALGAVAAAIGGSDGTDLDAVSTGLRLGADWDAAWARAPARWEPLCTALRTTWVDGAAPAEALRAAADGLRADRSAATKAAAARLAVRLVLPLGACYLPAFVFIGVVPILLALGRGLLTGL